jgi:hypothetical protein
VRASVKRRAIAGTLGPLEITLYHYAYGKPKESVSVDVKIGRMPDLSTMSLEELKECAEHLTQQLREANELEEQLNAIDVTPKAVALLNAADEER